MASDLLSLSGSLIGGLGLFLLAIGMMTDGLKQAAGPSLRKLLSSWTTTPFKGIFTGFTMTALVQSSSAVTVASIGFVNAGLLNMRQALGLVYGANVGTTMTGWLVALIGFKLNIQAFALPMIGIGMLVKLIKTEGRAASFGLALVGFGLFFVGIDVLKTAFEGVVATFDITQFKAEGIYGIVVFLLVGIVMTMLTQSSSAAIALTITAASSNMIGIYAAAAMVIGANVGTTSTAVLASIGATSNAKRVAAAQVIFNIATAIVALAILPVLFYLIALISETAGFTADPSISLALFHSLFNVLGVLLIYPFNNRLAARLDNHFLSWEEKESHPKYLDKTIAFTPELAVNALYLEMISIGNKVSHLCSQAFFPNNAHSTSFKHKVDVIKLLSTEVSRFIVSIESAKLSEETTQNLTVLMRVEQYFLSCTLLTERVARYLSYREKFVIPELEQKTEFFFNKVLDFVNADWNHKEMSLDVIETQFNELQANHDKLKARLLLSGTMGDIPVNQMFESIDCIGETIRMNQQWFKAVKRLKALQKSLNGNGVSHAEPEKTEQPAETMASE